MKRDADVFLHLVVDFVDLIHEDIGDVVLDLTGIVENALALRSDVILDLGGDVKGDKMGAIGVIMGVEKQADGPNLIVAVLLRHGLYSSAIVVDLCSRQEMGKRIRYVWGKGMVRLGPSAEFS